MAKWSKVVDLCSNLSEDVGSNATIARILFLNQGITAGVLTPIKCSENLCKGYTNIWIFWTLSIGSGKWDQWMNGSQLPLKMLTGQCDTQITKTPTPSVFAFGSEGIPSGLAKEMTFKLGPLNQGRRGKRVLEPWKCMVCLIKWGMEGSKEWSELLSHHFLLSVNLEKFRQTHTELKNKLGC